MKIVNLNIQNIKRIVAVEITPDGNTVVIGGANGAGKTSLLDSIMYALAGGKGVPDQPVRRGAEKGSIKIDLGEFVVERTFSKKGTYLKVRGKDGRAYSSPQALLDELVGSLSFDPLAFTRMDDKKQLEELKRVAGLDFSDIEAKHVATYDKRREVNSTLKSHQNILDGMAPEHPETPETPVDVAALMAELDNRRKANQAVHTARRETAEKKASLERAAEQLVGIRQRIASHQQEIEQLQHDDAELAEALKRDAAAVQKQEESVAAMVEQDEAEISEEITDAGQINANVNENKARRDTSAVAVKLQKSTDSLTRRLTQLDSQKAKMVQDAKMPVDGLALDDAGIMLNGFPLSQASSAEQLKLSVAMGLAMNPKLKVLLIRDGSLLDQESLETIGEMASKGDAQVWIERVGTGEEVSVVIEDGMVAGQ